jgi:ABC-2 type transport system permease protein
MLPLEVLTALFVRDASLALRYRFHLAVRYGVSLLGVFFLYYLGRFVSTRPLSGSTDYFSYVLVGFVLSQYFSQVLVSLSRSVRDDQLIGTAEPLFGSPVSPFWLALGASLFPLVEGFLVACAQLTLGGLILGADLGGANWWGFAAVAGASLVALQALAFLSAAFVVVFKKGDPVTPLMAASSFLFTGVFFPIEQLPWVFRWLSYCIPITYALRGSRSYVLGGVHLTHAAALNDIKILLAIAAVTVPLTIWLFGRAVRHARRTGTLCHY